MSKKTKKVLAIVALVFMGIFTIALVVWFTAPKLWNGAVGYLTLFTGSVGIGLFLIIKLVKTPEEKEELAKQKAAYLPTPEKEPMAEQKTDAIAKTSQKPNNDLQQDNASISSQEINNKVDNKKTL